MVIQAGPKIGCIASVFLRIVMFIVKPETADIRNVGMEEVAIAFKSIQREAAERCGWNIASEIFKT